MNILNSEKNTGCPDKIKITFFVGSLSGGGAERVVCNLANYLAKKGYDVTVLTVSKTADDYFTEKTVKLLSLDKGKKIKFTPLRVLVKMCRLKKYLKTCDSDVAVAFLPKTIYALMRYKKHIKCPVVLSERCYPGIYPAKQLKAMLKCFKAVEGAVFQTEEIKNFYTDRLKLKSYAVIPNAVNPEFVTPPYVGERKKQIVSVGRHSKQKNFTLLIRAFKSVADKFPDYTLKIYGKGELTQSYIKLCEELNIKNRVEFPGYRNNMQDELNGSALFVLPSDYEGMPNALIEAMSLSVPCVSTDSSGGGARALINDGENGLLVPTGDVTALAAAIEKVLSDKTFADKIALNAVKIRETLNLELVYGMWENYLLKVVKGEV